MTLQRLLDFFRRRQRATDGNEGRRNHVFTVRAWDAPGEFGRWEYRVGYRKAADALVLKAVNDETHPTERIGFIYPVMFLYRHCIEITLKDLFYWRRLRCYHAPAKGQP
jgi:hypothetical protein